MKKLDFDYKMNILNGALLIYESFRGQRELADEIVDAIIEEYVGEEMYEEASVMIQARTMVNDSRNERNCTVFPREPEI